MTPSHAEVCARLRAEIERCDAIFVVTSKGYPALLRVALEVAERHAPDGSYFRPICLACPQDWPCFEARLVAAFAETLEPSK
jgi:hypothetical protein